MTTVGEFLRARREQVQPADVGLPDGGRRRTPGLRREEVATLAGVSIDYLIRLEQGRDTRPSASVVIALAEALRLDDDDRRELWKLAVIGESAQMCPEARPLALEVAPTVAVLVEALHPTPAFVVGPSTDVLGWNDAFADLVRPLGLLEDLLPNLARYVFLHPSARDVFLDWDAVADEQVSRLLATVDRWGGDPRFGELLDELRTSPEFTTRWSAVVTSAKRRGTMRIAHPDAGRLHLHHEALVLPDDEEDQRLVTWLPADAATKAALAELTGGVPVSPAKLRSIS